jgi:chromosome segregation ATPase
VQAEIGRQFEQASGEPARKQIIGTYLVPLANSLDERQRYQEAVRDPKVTAQTLKQQLDGLIALAVGEGTSTGAKRGLDARKERIADLLVRIVPADQAWLTRVQTVVGLEKFVGAVDRQAANLSVMADQLQTAIADEQTAFARAYQSILPELQRLADQLRDMDARLKEQQELVQRHTVLRNGRQAEVAEFQKQIQEATARVARETAALSELQQQLFSLQQDVAAAQVTNQRLEQQLRTKELGK